MPRGEGIYDEQHADERRADRRGGAVDKSHPDRKSDKEIREATPDVDADGGAQEPPD
ncbi:hypothetical protein M1247_03940 [Mycobacterium sp. 21AC1]|uniref:hypothetical protein n=1 Tax=[Mycobacterium] appelbergii TaxID=2939269 RepID=UPI0029391068|nr:hypothetical protein [Mycobacterium sp. 21AC1]MDV3124053.1 hypothetical protein [Mycobacterium sp. 21AC1]